MSYWATLGGIFVMCFQMINGYPEFAFLTLGIFMLIALHGIVDYLRLIYISRGMR